MRKQFFLALLIVFGLNSISDCANDRADGAEKKLNFKRDKDSSYTRASWNFDTI